MIKLRDIRGRATELPPDTVFVEICDTAGAPAAVLLTTPDGAHQLVQSGDEAFERYKTMFKLDKTSRIIQLPK